MEKRLVRSNDRMIAGVCSGLGEYFNIDPTLVRLLFIVFGFTSLGSIAIPVYLILWVIVPQAGGSQISEATAK